MRCADRWAVTRGRNVVGSDFGEVRTEPGRCTSRASCRSQEPSQPPARRRRETVTERLEHNRSLLGPGAAGDTDTSSASTGQGVRCTVVPSAPARSTR
jgi:hypothetical protein